ncbi:MAG: hypothetical protein AABX29_06915 [Nanoarchaeota archaeon]
MEKKIDTKIRTVNVSSATAFFQRLDKGSQLKPPIDFRGLKLKNRSSLEMICDCCGDGDDCCGFN